MEQSNSRWMAVSVVPDSERPRMYCRMCACTAVSSDLANALFASCSILMLMSRLSCTSRFSSMCCAMRLPLLGIIVIGLIVLNDSFYSTMRLVCEIQICYIQ